MARTIVCMPCNRTFKSQDALDSHRKYSSAHSHRCATCPEGFRTQSDLLTHTLSTGHIPQIFECRPCGSGFPTETILQAHCKSQVHQAMLQSPLNAFFRSWPNFPFETMLSPHESWDQLQRFYGLENNESRYREAWIRYQDALALEVTIWFGKFWLLESWQKLFYALGMTNAPRNCAEGEWAVRFLFVNVIDLIHWARTSGAFGAVVSFPLWIDFCEYSADTRKIFQRDPSGHDEDNVVLRFLAHCILPRGLPPTFRMHQDTQYPYFWFSAHQG